MILPKIRWRIEIGRKPRGRWRPPITIEFWTEGSNELNIDPSFDVRVASRTLKREVLEGACIHGCKKLNEIGKYIPSDFVFFKSENSRDMSPADFTCCTKFSYFELLKTKDIFEKIHISKFYAEWRPGTPPDYTDHIDFLIKIIQEYIVNEFNRRVQEAFESPEYDGFVITDTNVFVNIANTEKNVRHACRKIKVG